MPIYEYFCDKCHGEFEELVFGEELPSCVHCGASQCHKLMSRPCKQHGAHGDGGDYSAPVASASSSSKCGGCSGGNCATCH